MASHLPPSSDGSVSPTSKINDAYAKYDGGQNHMPSPIHTSFASKSAWAGSPVATGHGLGIDPFAALSPAGSLRGSASSFKPGVEQLSRSLRILSLGSTDDKGPVIVSSSSSSKNALSPIGTKGSGSNSPVRPRGCFSTDVNPDKPAVGGHFIMIQGLKASELDNGLMSVVDKEYKADIRGKKIIKHSEDDSEVDLVLFIDDLRKSSKIVADLDSVGNITVSHVSYDWYTSAGSPTLGNSVEPMTMYVGQVTFVAEFKGRTADFKPNDDVWAMVKKFSEDIGAVLAFDQNKAAPYPTWQFRVEFFKSSDAENAIASTVEAVKLGEAKGWFISAKQYAPPSSFGATPDLAPSSRASTSSSQTAVIPHGATVHTSPTGRTSWYTDGEGNNHALPAPQATPGPERVSTETAVTPYRGDGPSQYDSTPRAPLRLSNGRLGYSTWPREYGYHDLEEYGQHDPRGQLADVAVERILAGHDVRTTVMLRNVPNEWTWQDVRALLDQVVRDRYNFMYLRIDFKVGKNVGYAFVNFENALDIVHVVDAFVGKPWDPMHLQYHNGALKTLQLSYATIQGIDSLIDKFRNSSIMDEMIDYRPLLLQTPEEFEKDEQDAKQLVQRGLPAPDICPVGERKEFPSPNNRAKKERSTANAALLGLFTPRGRGLPVDRLYRSQYDRGTPAQLIEDAHFNSFGGYAPPPFAMAPSMVNYTYGPPRGQAMYNPALAQGLPFAGVMTAPPSMMPRTPYTPETPTRPHFGNGRSAFGAQNGVMGYGMGPARWNGPPVVAGGHFSPGLHSNSSPLVNAGNGFGYNGQDIDFTNDSNGDLSINNAAHGHANI